MNKDRIIGDIRTLFEQEDYYEPKWVSHFWNNNYFEYESHGDKNRNLSLDKYLNKIKSSKFWHMENSVNNCNKLYFFKRC